MATIQDSRETLPTPPLESKTLIHPHTATTTTNATPEAHHRHIWIVIGPAGCGKTSIAERLRSTFDLPFLEGDDFHTPENVEKMRSGHPLTDGDRWDWLITLREESLKALQTSRGVVLTCSALKRKYRDVIRVAAYHNPDVRVNFIYLNVSEAVLIDRVNARQHHYMKGNMVHSQIQSLEAPMADELDILSVDASGTSIDVQELAVTTVEQAMNKERAQMAHQQVSSSHQDA